MICKYFVIIIELMTYTLLVVLQRLAGIKEDWFSCEWMYRLLVNSWNRSILNDTHKSLYTKMSVEAYLLSYKQFNFRWRQNSIFCHIAVLLYLCLASSNENSNYLYLNNYSIFLFISICRINCSKIFYSKYILFTVFYI